MSNVIFTKKTIALFLSIALIMSINIDCFCKIDAFTNKYYDEPFGEPTEYFSENTIIDKKRIDILNPLNPTPSDVTKDEKYILVNNYNIDLRTLSYRVEFFSPTYLYAKEMASNTLATNIYMGGGNLDNIDTLKQTIDSLPSKKGPYESTVKSLQTAISGYTKAFLLLKNINNNYNLINAKNQLTKAMSSAIISYKQLDSVIKIYEGQVKLYTEIFDLYQKNAMIGLATSKEVKKSQVDLQEAKKTLSSYKNTQKYLKELIAYNLGYGHKDIDLLNFVDPVVNEEYANHINPSDDYQNAIYSNQTYNSFRQGGESNKKLPESTSRQSYDNLLKLTEGKIITALDELYATVLATKKKYEISTYDRETLTLNKQIAKNMLTNDLTSKTEYLGLQVKNYATELDVANAKYNYISAINNYYYASQGIVDID